MNIISTYKDMESIFDTESINIENWKAYMDKCVPGAKEMCIADMQECVDAGFSWEKDFLPVLDFVRKNPVICEQAIKSFQG